MYKSLTINLGGN